MPDQVQDKTPWMTWLRHYLGEPEVTGADPTDFDRMVFAHTNYGGLKDKMQPGCAATACAALEETGFASTHSAAALSFADYGMPCDLQPGCVVVFQWKDGTHHVTFCDHIVNDTFVACLGGNQSHKVSIAQYSREYIIATRWPVSKDVPVSRA